MFDTRLDRGRKLLQEALWQMAEDHGLVSNGRSDEAAFPVA